jgi:hypothetical protein
MVRTRISLFAGWNVTTNNNLIRTVDDILLKDASLRALPPTPVRDHLSVFNWIYGEKPLDKDQYDFIYHQDDFVSLTNRPQKGFDNFIETYLNRSHGSCIQVKSILLPSNYANQVLATCVRVKSHYSSPTHGESKHR